MDLQASWRDSECMTTIDDIAARLAIVEKLGDLFPMVRRLDDRLDNVERRLVELRDRVGGLERGQADISIRIGHVETNVATIGVRIDRIDDRLDRVERRLELKDA